MTGKGGYVKTSLLANGLYANGCMLQGRFENIDFEGLFPAPPRPERSMPLANIYRAGCGRWLFLAILNDRQLGPLCEALGCPEVAADPKFSTDAARRENNKEMIAFLDAKFATKDRDHWNAALNKAGVTFTTIATMDDVYNDEQAKAAGLVVKFEDGGSWTVNSPFEVDGQKKVTPKRVAAVGQHTREVLKEAGYSEKEIEDMVSSGAVAVKAKL
jgi:formyl-CoA transferase